MLNPSYSVNEIAEFLGCKPEKVSSLIASKQLVAFDASLSRGAKKKRWRVTQESLQDFINSRSSRPVPEPVKRATRSFKPALKSYF